MTKFFLNAVFRDPARGYGRSAKVASFGWAIIAAIASMLVPFVMANGPPSQLRQITVDDVIASTEFVGLTGGNAVLYSPNGKRFVVVTKKGNASNNTNVYSLLLFEMESTHRSPAPNVLVSLSSSSLNAAIQTPKWVGDDTIAFLSSDAAGVQQLFAIDCKTKELKKLTAHATDVVAYAISASGESFFFVANTTVQSLLTKRAAERGIIVSEQELSDLITLRDQRYSDEHQVLLRQSKHGGPEIIVQTRGINGVSAFDPPPELSPDGQYLIIKTVGPDTPPGYWKDYQDRILQGELRQGEFERQMASYEFEVVDAVSGERRVLLNAPSGYGHSEVAWSADGRSVVISGTYLPLDGSTEDESRTKFRYVAEIDVLNGSVTPVTNQDVRLQRWDATTNTLLFRESTGFTSDSPPGGAVGYRKRDGVWKRVEVDERELSGLTASVKAVVEEDLNTPPRLFVEHVMTGRRSVLFDPNPQFKTLRFARVEPIAFQVKNGSTAKGALYLPVNYVAGRRYPLVIQTHALNLQRFAIDGPYPTAFAAQPLAGRGIAVVQLEEDWGRLEAPGEVTDEVAVYEAVIDYLYGRGIVDRARVGLIGFSRTGLAVEYMLTHSAYPVSAASLADISDAGYFRYFARIKDPESARDSEIINGGIPFGTGLRSWLENSPGFNLDKVRTPVLLSAQSPISLLYVWEWFAGLSRLAKPVELLYMPEADHVLVKPQDRIISQGGNVDWFEFWLNGREDSESAKSEQYRLWERLCDLQKAANPDKPAFCVGTKH